MVVGLFEIIHVIETQVFQKSLIKVSEETYFDAASGLSNKTLFPMALSKWVFPKPGPPKSKEGDCKVHLDYLKLLGQQPLAH